MIKRFSKICTAMTFVVVMVFNSSPVQAQLDALDNLFNANTADVEALTKAYLDPFATGLSTSLNSGWTAKAAPTKKLGFSVQVRFAAASVPSSAQSFDVNDLALSGDYRIEGTSSSTISGEDNAGQRLFPIVGGIESPTPITMPNGVGVSIVPVAMLQGNVGLIKGTDVTVRYIPETALGDFGDISLTGFGVKHGLNQWLPGGKLLPVDISLMAAYTSMSLNAEVDTDQNLETTTDAFVVNALVGKTLPFLSAYAGVGFQSGTFELDLEEGGLLASPINYSQDSDAAIHALAGVQFKIAILRIYAEATVAEYSSYNIGVGIGLR